MSDTDQLEQGEGAQETKYEMKLSFNVLNHLGLNLYSNVPSVLAEAVANSWDADAHNVHVDIYPDEGRVVITDDGHGMDEFDVNERYLNVGYNRRQDDERGDRTEEGRYVMGRKGIGKLSLFSIARTAEVYTRKNGEENAFRMTIEDIREEIEKENSEDSNSPRRYHPKPIPFDNFPEEYETGTRVILSDLKKTTWQTAEHLRRRLARRFSVIGPEENFWVNVNGKQIKVTDRDYFHKVRYLWRFGDGTREYVDQSDPEKDHSLDGTIAGNYSVRGWIGTAKSSSDLETESGNINKISLIVRGKLAKEDLLEDINKGGIYTKYLFGEIHADFLDDSGEDDIATTDRESIKKTDERYQLLIEYLTEKITKIGSSWEKYRDDEGAEEALKVPEIDDWYDGLSTEHRESADKMFGTINRMGIEDDDEKRNVFAHSVIAFESLRQRKSLDKLERISPDNWHAISQILGEVDDIERALYHRIVKHRLSVIKKLREDTDENAIERILQEHLYEYPWLLDTAWERATEEKRMEERLEKLFEDEFPELTEDERLARFDLVLMSTGGKYLLVELKRYDPTYRLETEDLLRQVKKYRSALLKILRKHKDEHDPNYEILCVIGEDLTDWETLPDDEEITRDQLKPLNARLVKYDKLINDAYGSYEEFINERDDEINRIERVVDAIADNESYFD